MTTDELRNMITRWRHTKDEFIFNLLNDEFIKPVIASVVNRYNFPPEDGSQECQLAVYQSLLDLPLSDHNLENLKNIVAQTCKFCICALISKHKRKRSNSQTPTRSLDDIDFLKFLPDASQENTSEIMEIMSLANLTTLQRKVLEKVMAGGKVKNKSEECLLRRARKAIASMMDPEDRPSKPLPFSVIWVPKRKAYKLQRGTWLLGYYETRTLAREAHEEFVKQGYPYKEWAKKAKQPKEKDDKTL